ncbi:MAG TPA: Clp protease N-terminal domain-containing protein, partial [Verrucomicrobiae bacterium]|nr:Clp protease N-terminal domain-containing protein [Verrucomicrobiae bacterium]
MSWLKSFWESLFTPDHGERLNNFTPLSHQVLALARKEAERLKHNFIDTEHLLLGLVKLQRGVAFNVLANTGLSLYDLVDEIEKQIGIGFNEPASGQLEYSNHAKKVLALA